MTNPAFETVDSPFTAFRFEVVIDLPASIPGLGSPLVNAAFAECDGLEMSIEPKTVQEGGANLLQTHLIGPVRYGQLTLRRGMTNNLDLWSWFLSAVQPGKVATAQAQVTLWDAAGQPRLTYELADCLPVRMRGPSLNAKDGQVAIEEIQLVYSGLDIHLPGETGFLLGLSAGGALGAGISAGFSAGGGAPFGVSAGGGFSAGGRGAFEI